MFTGIVEEIGRVQAIEMRDRHAHMHIACDTVLDGTGIGDSIAIDGCCVTVTTLPDGGFTCDLMAETLQVTALGDLRPGAGVNLERAMPAGARLGGHLVQGHVDGVGEIVDRQEQPGTVFLTVQVLDELTRYLVAKGSVTVAGVSLTVVDIDHERFRIGLIPHTLEVTTLGTLDVGNRVNLEVDVIAKYVERLLAGGTVTPYAGDAIDRART